MKKIYPVIIASFSVFLLLAILIGFFIRATMNSSEEYNYNPSSNLSSEGNSNSILNPTFPEDKNDAVEIQPQYFDVTGYTAFSGGFYDYDEYYYTYSAPVSGNYRFDPKIDDFNKDYSIEIKDFKSQSIGRSSFSDGGKNVELEKGQQYTIIVKNIYGKPSYGIAIGIPKEPQSVVGNSISGNLEYKNQYDQYIFSAPITGRYNLDFDISDVTASYSVEVYSDKKEQLFNSRSSDKHRFIDLEEGKSYTICIKQYSDYPDYSIYINIPNAIEVISGNVISGSLTFRDQINEYYYTPSETGDYKLRFDSSNAQGNYRIKMYSETNKELFSTDYRFSWYLVTLKAGERYRIAVSQSYDFMDYTISIQLN